MRTGRYLPGNVVVLAVITALPLLVAVVAFGCEGATTTTQATVPTTQATTTTTQAAPPTAQETVGGLAPSAEIVSLLEGRIDAWNRGDGQATAAFYALGAILEEADNGLVTQGRTQIAARLQELMDGFKMEEAGPPLQMGGLVVEPVNLLLDGQPGLYLLVFSFGPGGEIYRQWVLPAGQWVSIDTPNPPTTEPPTTASTGAANTPVTTTFADTMSRTLKWGEGGEIQDRYAVVERPTEDTSAPKSESKKIVVANVKIGGLPGGTSSAFYDAPDGTWVAYDDNGYIYTPVSMPPELTSHPPEAYMGTLAFEIPRNSSIKRIVWEWPVFEWVNVLIWE